MIMIDFGPSLNTPIDTDVGRDNLFIFPQSLCYCFPCLHNISRAFVSTEETSSRSYTFIDDRVSVSEGSRNHMSMCIHANDDFTQKCPSDTFNLSAGEIC